MPVYQGPSAKVLYLHAFVRDPHPGVSGGDIVPGGCEHIGGLFRTDHELGLPRIKRAQYPTGAVQGETPLLHWGENLPSKDLSSKV